VSGSSRGLSCDGADTVITPHRRSHAGAGSRGHLAPSSDLSAASQVAKEQQTSDGYGAEPLVPPALQRGSFGDRVIRPQLSPSPTVASLPLITFGS
jgi:hypothetical protein